MPLFPPTCSHSAVPHQISLFIALSLGHSACNTSTCPSTLLGLLQSGKAGEEDSEGLQELQHALLVIMTRLETLAVSAAAGDLMPALAPALAQSLADVRGLDCTPEASAPAWECLSDLLCSTVAQAAQVIHPLHPLFLLW